MAFFKPGSIVALRWVGLTKGGYTAGNIAALFQLVEPILAIDQIY